MTVNLNHVQERKVQTTKKCVLIEQLWYEVGHGLAVDDDHPFAAEALVNDTQVAAPVLNGVKCQVRGTRREPTQLVFRVPGSDVHVVYSLTRITQGQVVE